MLRAVTEKMALSPIKNTNMVTKNGHALQEVCLNKVKGDKAMEKCSLQKEGNKIILPKPKKLLMKHVSQSKKVFKSTAASDIDKENCTPFTTKNAGDSLSNTQPILSKVSVIPISKALSSARNKILADDENTDPVVDIIRKPRCVLEKDEVNVKSNCSVFLKPLCNNNENLLPVVKVEKASLPSTPSIPTERVTTLHGDKNISTHTTQAITIHTSTTVSSSNITLANSNKIQSISRLSLPIDISSTTAGEKLLPSSTSLSLTANVDIVKVNTIASSSTKPSIYASTIDTSLNTTTSPISLSTTPQTSATTEQQQSTISLDGLAVASTIASSSLPLTTTTTATQPTSISLNGSIASPTITPPTAAAAPTTIATPTTLSTSSEPSPPSPREEVGVGHHLNQPQQHTPTVGSALPLSRRNARERNRVRQVCHEKQEC